jgi:NADH-quinone oxidoreductase subunit J
VATVVVSALGILFTRNVWYGALWLALCIVAVAGLFVLAFAEFLAVVQLLVYAGGIVVLLIFGIMITSRWQGKIPLASNKYVPAGTILCAVLMGLLGYGIFRTKFSGFKTPVAGTDQLAWMGKAFIAEYALIFEIIGLLLLIALVGAVLVSSAKTPHADDSV